MKTTKTISLSELLKEVGLIATKLNQTYYCATADLTHNLMGQVVPEFRVYVSGQNWYIGETPNEALTKLKEACFGKKESVIKDVLIEEA